MSSAFEARTRERWARGPLAQLTMARIREFAREPEAMFWTFGFPIVIALVLGIAFAGRGPETIRVGVEAGPDAAELAGALEAADGMAVGVMAPDDARDALRRGEVAIVVAAGGSGDVVYRYDPSRPDARHARLAVDDALQRAAGRRDARPVRAEPVQERGSRYIDFLIPGLIGFNLLGTGLWGAGYSVVRMRSGGLLKRFLATPMRRSQFLLSFMFGRLVFLFAEIAVLLFFAWIVFGVTVAGSLFHLGLIAVLGAFCFTGLGLLIASRARTTEGIAGLMNLAALPMWVLSGVFFSYHYFPDALHPYIKALPLTAAVDALRAVMVDGAALAATIGSLGVVAAWTAGAFGLTLAIFRWR